jgi:hypothetical protein
VDACGLLLVVQVTIASIQDRDGRLRLPALLRQRFATVSLVWADGDHARRLLSCGGWPIEGPRSNPERPYVSMTTSFS